MNIKQIYRDIILSVIMITGCTTTQSEPTLIAPTVALSYGKTYTLQNKSVMVVVAPEIGRIIHFGYVDGSNMIWLKDLNKLAIDKAAGTEWLNWGGDKIWPSQQADWSFIYGGGNWPPKSELDVEPFKVIEASEHGLVIESTLDTKLNVKLRRSLVLDQDQARLTISNSLTRVESSPWPVHIWSVTQSLLPSYTLLGISNDAPERESRPFSNLWDAALPEANAQLMHSALRLSLEPELTIAKAGTIGNWCAGVYDDTIFLQESDSPADGCYPDGASIEVFLCERYTELEILSPSIHLKKNESISGSTVWSLIKTTPEASTEENLKLIEISID